MPRYLWIFTVGLVLLGLAGCGGDDAKKDEKKDAANNAAPPAMGGGMPGMGAGMPGMGGGMPGMGGGAAAPAAAPAEKTAAADSSGSGSAQGLLKYIPEDIDVAAGVNVSAVFEKDTPYSELLKNQFSPVLSMLDGAGIKSSQIDQLWSGTNRAKEDMVICVRTKAAYNAAAITKALGATGNVEKVGSANLRQVSKNPDFKNAVAYIDSKTLLIGRYNTVVAALKNPKPGAIRAGLDALAQPKALFWISGVNDESAKKLHIKGFEGLDWFIEGAPKPRGMAISVTNEFDGTQKAGGGQGGAPGMPGGAPGMPGGAPGMPGGAPGMPGGGGGPGMPGMPGMGMPGMGMPGMGMPGMGMPGMGGGGGGGGATATKPIEVRVAWGFTSDAAAKLMNEIMQSMIDAINEANKPPSGAPGGMPGGMPGGGPGGAGPGGPPGPGGGMPGGRGGRGGKGRRGARIFSPMGSEILLQPGPGMPGGAGGPGMPGMPGMGGAVDDSKVTYYRIEQTGENLKLIYHIPKDDVPTVTKLVGRIMSASGLPALDDGLFQGTLSLLNKGIHGWEAAKPDQQLIGMKRMGAQMRILAGYSWMTELLPHVGYEPLYRKFDFSQTWAMPYNAPYAQVVIPAFLNPADPRATSDGLGEAIAATHFAGMSGVEGGRNEVAAELPRTDPRAGIFGYDKVARFNEISDGASQTIMMIGTGEVVAAWVQAGGATIRGARQPYFDKYTGFGSRGVKSGAYVMFADGSARVISDKIDPEIFKAMCTIHGAEQIDMGKLIGQGDK